MKYKVEFKADEAFEKGRCYDCPLSYYDSEYDCAIPCRLHSKYDGCPLVEVKD